MWLWAADTVLISEVSLIRSVLYREVCCIHVCTMHYTLFTLSPAVSTATGEVHVLWNVTLNHLEHVVITTQASTHKTRNYK